MKLIQCPKCIVGHVEEGEDYSNATHIAKCNNCSSEFWINYTKVYDLETLKNEYNQKAGGESPQDLWPTDPGPGQIPGRSWTRVIYFQGRRCYGSQIYFIRWVSPNLNKKARLKHRVFFFTRRVASYVPGRKCPELSGSRMPWPYPAQLGKNPVNAGFFLPGRIYHARVRKRSQNLRAKQNVLERKNI